MLKGKFCIETRDDEVSAEIGNKLKEFLLASGVKEDLEDPDYVFAIGGDGTVLRTFNKHIDNLDKIKFLSIHTIRFKILKNYFLICWL